MVGKDMRAWGACILGALLGLAPPLASAGDAQPKRPLVLAVHPYLVPEEIERRFAPLAAFIGRTLGEDVVVRVGGSYAEHISAIGRDQVDLAFMGPAPYVRMLEHYGSKPLLARFEVAHQPNLHGVIVVAQASPLRTLAALRGRRFAFGDADSTMSYYVPAWLLIKNGLPLAALGGQSFLGSHPNVALAVLAGDYDAGALKREVYDEYAAGGLRILAELPATPDYLFVARADFPPATVVKLRAALLTLDSTAEGRRILTELHPGLTRLIPAAESDYQALREMISTVVAAP
jgi:phosphonate transport system substrate-binding protein